MNAALRHRGPDDEGITPLVDASGEPVGTFAHRRLAVIDLSEAGHQPMVSGDGRYTLVFNGEIYNYRELRRELEREGASFRSGSDTEVILAGWAVHGPALLPRLRGMFAFALWDRAERCGWLARDPFGIKPVYLAEIDGQVLFASELRALLATGRVARRLSSAAVASYLATGSVQEPLSMIEGVRMLPAASLIRVDVRDGQASLGPARVHTPLFPRETGPRETDPARAARLVREALRESVEYHMVSDVPVAFFLSGGIDSSATVALASECAGGPLETFTIAFHEREYNEAAPARAVAERFGCRHHEVYLSGDDFLAALPEAFATMDQPSMDGLNTYVVSRAVRAAGVKVVLSGLGGDEMFAGYPSFARARRIAPLWAPGAGPLRRTAARALRASQGVRGEKLAGLLGERDAATAAYHASRSLFTPGWVRALTRGAVGPEPERAPAGLPLLEQVSFMELSGYMRNTLLRDSDVFSMAQGLELRVPFVDRGVLAASRAVADPLKLGGRSPKPLLVAALGELLPREVWDRPKQGFVLPMERWLRGPLRAAASAAFAPPRLERIGLAPETSSRVWEAFVANDLSWSRPWSLFTLVRWAEENEVSVEGGAPLPRAALLGSR